MVCAPRKSISHPQRMMLSEGRRGKRRGRRKKLMNKWKLILRNEWDGADVSDGGEIYMG